MDNKTPLNSPQSEIFAECMQNKAEALYNVPYIFKATKKIDLPRLKNAILKALEAHPYTSCRVKIDDEGTAVQYIDTAGMPEIVIEEIADIEAEKKRLPKNMYLDGEPLVYFKLLSAPDANYIFFQFHHIVIDGSSLIVLFSDIDAAYRGESLSQESYTSLDFAAEENALRESKAMEDDRLWYKEHFACDDVDTDLAPDVDGADFCAKTVEIDLAIDAEVVGRLCKSNGVKRSDFFTSAFALLLSRYTAEDDVLFSTIWNGRGDTRLNRTLGMFVRTFPAIFHIDGEMTVAELLQHGAETSDGVRSHLAYSYSEFCSEHGVNPQIMFAYQGKLFHDVGIDGEKLEIIQLFDNITDRPLEFQLFQTDEGYRMVVSYHAHIYSDVFVSQLVKSYETVIAQMTVLDRKLNEISILSDEGLRLIDSFNDTDVDYDESQTVVSMFRQQALRNPDKLAVVYNDVRLTYRDLDEKTDAIALRIASSGLGLEDVVAVLIPRCELMAVVSLGVLKAGCAYQPLDPGYPKERLDFMLRDSGAKLLIADSELYPLVEGYAGEVLMTSGLYADVLTQVKPTPPLPGSLMTMIYTSGTTGLPKGCQIEHRNVVAFCLMHQHCHNITSSSRVSAYASYGFDASIEEIFGPLTAGAELHIIPDEIRLDLAALNGYFEDNGITHAFMTTQVAYQFATNFKCASLQRLLTGGEKLPSLNPPDNYIVCNGYGPSESICYVTNFDVVEKRRNIPVGKAQMNVKCYIVDKYGHRLPVGAAGELWVAGPQVTRGYLNRPDKTAEVYMENPFNTSPKYSRVYRSGDMVRYLPSGDVDFVGRKDGQVKIRGFRVELKEVEGVIRDFPGIKDATVQAFDDEGGGKFIAAYIVADTSVDIDALNDFIRDRKPPYMVPAATMQIDAIPLNQNQKVNKKALPEPVRSRVSSDSGSAAPLNILEAELHKIIAGVIGSEDFGVTTELAYAGLTSISAIKLAVQINKRFGITLDSKSLVKQGTLQSVENEILEKMMCEEKEKTEIPEPAHADMSGTPLSYSQMGVYMECMKQPLSTVYNVPSMVTFPRNTDTTRLMQSLEKIVDIHPMFKVHFGNLSGEIVQVYDSGQSLQITQTAMDDSELDKRKNTFVRPFNLSQGPLYRMEIVSTETKVALLMDVHHLIFDGASMNIFLTQLADLMDGRDIEAENFTFADFVAGQKDAEVSGENVADKEFFHEMLGKVEGVTEIPSDMTNPSDEGRTGCVCSALDFDTVSRFCRKRGFTPAHLTLAAVYYALSRFSNSEQVCMTTISNGRSDLRIQNTVGMFVNTLALSAEVGSQTVEEFLKETAGNFDATLTHEQYPFAKISSDYDLAADIMFAYQIGVLDRYICGGEELKVENLELDIPKFKIAFYIKEMDGCPSVCIEYDNGRYSEELMQSLAESVANAARAFVDSPDIPLRQISLLDKSLVATLDSFNATEVPYDSTQTVVSLFRMQARQNPSNVAVVFQEKKFSYAEVDEITDRIASYIQSKGLGREDVVSVIIPRSEWMVMASLGVLKAGCAYQPLDPSYPAERLNFMVDDAGAKLLIADAALRPLVSEYAGPVLLTDDIDGLPASRPSSIEIRPSDLFIMLYTSGSTGVPKGCQLEHGNISAFCHWYQRNYELSPDCRVAAYASYGFDACMMDMYPALTCGACVHIIGEDIRLNLPDLNNYFNQNGITHSFMTTQVGYQFATNVDNRSLRCFAVGGEKLSALNPPANYRMYNGYGPTECTIFTTNYLVKEYEADIPIGRPLDNMKLYIVDKQGNRLPAGAVGELWVSGPQVSRGYLNRPEKTAEVYVSNPFDDDTRYSRVYRTGDIVRYLHDGNVQFVGRKDGQVKIRGFRIEMKEVEAVIRQYPGVQDVTVQAFDYDNGGKYIAAYVVSGETVDVKALNAFISSKKPSYMVPAATMQVDNIPLTQNQKVNRKALPKPVIQASDREYVAPANDVETVFCNIFADVLAMDKAGATDNFFDLGGTSLMVTRVIIEADKAGMHVAYGDFFTNPTPRDLAVLVKGGTDSGKEEREAAEFDYSSINRILEYNNIESFKKGECLKTGCALLTGATGYLGIHVLKELLDSGVPEIHCLVRESGVEAAEHRLKTLLFYYFENTYDELFGSRLRIVLGNVTDDLSAVVTAKVDTVFNCAAVVKHFSKGTEIEDVNIGGAKRCAEFCEATGARLVHISTTSTGGVNVDGKVPSGFVFTEQKLFNGQYIGNQYVYSKFVAERLVLQAVADGKIDAKVIRVGNLSARSTDGEFQVNFSTNAFMGRIKVYNMLGCLPYELYEQKVEFSPINEVAKSVVLLSSAPKECCLFHVYNSHCQFLGDVLTQLKSINTDIKFVEREEFDLALKAASDDVEKSKTLSSLLAYQDIAHGKKVTEIPTDNFYTTQVLHRLGFSWSATTWDYIDRMFSAIGGLGFFEM